MSTLYRDYRPQSFAEVLGQNHIKITLQNEIQSQRLANAYLFCGPRAVGKTTLARILAKSLNCESRKDKEYEPCNQCASCLSITKGSNLDIIEIDAASNTGVDNVRENIIASARIAPQTKYKVFIIDEVHMLSLSAFNALLKIIEEPPQKVVFILCTTEIHKVPATIISRCERFDFKRISISEVAKKLNFIASQEKIEIAPDILDAIARQANGYMRDAESLLGQVMALGDKKISSAQAELILPNYNSQEIVEFLDCLSQKDAARAIRLLNQLVDSGLNIKNFVGEVINVLRKIIFNQLNPSLASGLGLDFGEALELKVAHLSETLDLKQWVFMIQEFLNVNAASANIFIAQLPLEIAVIKICHGLSDQTVATLKSGTANISRQTVSPSSPKPGPSVSPLGGINSNSGPVLNLDQSALKDKWPELLINIKKYNHSLSFILQNCQALEIKDSRLSLVFKYKFHKDRISDPQIKEIIAKALQETFGSLLEIEAKVDENLDLSPAPLAPASSEVEPENKDKDKERPDMLGKLLQAFGGEVVN
ncbi:MAG: DNA polymerase III subunit gamma/tau [Patescibacteria group bacterium]